MKRWFIARMVEVSPDEWGPKVATYPNVNFRLWSKDGFAFGLGQLATNNLDQFTGDNDIKLIPDAALDNLLSSLSAQTRNNMRNGLEQGGFDITAYRIRRRARRLLIG